MKFTLSWLKDYLETDASLDQISQTLTAIGLEVEEITDLSTILAPFVVGEVLEAGKHPDADKLNLCKVSDGKNTHQVVCGAHNVRTGMKGVFAPIGSTIPDSGMVLKKSKIRGVESQGMLCSVREMTLGDDHDGIIELPDDATPGEPVAPYLGGGDPMIEIAITPNRGDCLGVYGIARDLAAAGLGTLKPLDTTPPKTHGASSITVTIDTPGQCPMFIGRTITGVKNGPSPEWLQQRLKAIGLRPISTLVDITNYITFTYGRPLHVYDTDTLTGNITVRAAKTGETLEALNDKNYKLEEGMCVIADDANVLGLGGIVGGVPSGCTETTTNVFLECALFDPIDIATTGRKLQINSDARFRFERSVDPKSVQTGAELATNMILELCSGQASELTIAGSTPEWKRSIPLDTSRLNALGGTHIDDKKIHSILEDLGCTIDGTTVTPPSWRPDIEQAADLAEEVLRIYGYDNIPSLPMPKPEHISKAVLTPAQTRIRTTRRLLASRGMIEVVSWAFLPEAQAKQFGHSNDGLSLLNPISNDLSTMRPSLLPNLLSAAMRNQSRGLDNLALFEIGSQFEDITPEGQKTMATGIRTGNIAPKNTYKEEREVDVFDAKADALAILTLANINPQIRAEAPAWYHPGRSGAFALGKNILGYFGELHPTIAQSFALENRAVGFEVFLDALPQSKSKASKAKPKYQASDYQAVERDFAFIADETLPAGDLIRSLEAADKKLITHVSLFDVYQGKGVEDGKKSLAISVTLQAQDRTLTEEEIETISKKIIEQATKNGASLRS